MRIELYRILSPALLVAMVAALSACGGGNATSTTPSTPTSAPTEAPAETTTAPKPAAQLNVVGGWKTNGGDFEEITIDADGTWASHLHARPLYSGTWKLDGTTLTLSSGAMGAPIVLTAVSLNDTTLTAKRDDKDISWTAIPGAP